MTLEMLLSWWNLLFVVPFGLAVIYLALYVFTGLTFGDHDVDMDVDHDVSFDHDIDADADTDLDADADADLDHDASIDAHSVDGHSVDAHAAHDGHTSGHSHPLAFLSLFGVGKIPVSLVLMIFCLLWGAIGFMLNQLLAHVISIGAVIGAISVPVTLAISLTLTGFIAALIARMLFSGDSKAARHRDLVGLSGDALYNIDATFGMASVRSKGGDLFQVPCRTPDARPPIPKGSRIVLFDYDEDAAVFHVAPFITVSEVRKESESDSLRPPRDLPRSTQITPGASFEKERK